MFFLTYFFFFFLTYYFSLFFHNLSNFFENSITRITIFVVRTVCIDVFIIYYHASMRFGHSSHAAAKGHTSAAAACTIWVACHGTGDWHAFAENAILCFAPTTVTLKMLIIRKMWSFFSSATWTKLQMCWLTITRQIKGFFSGCQIKNQNY